MLRKLGLKKWFYYERICTSQISKYNRTINAIQMRIFECSKNTSETPVFNVNKQFYVQLHLLPWHLYIYIYIFSLSVILQINFYEDLFSEKWAHSFLELTPKRYYLHEMTKILIKMYFLWPKILINTYSVSRIEISVSV